MGAFMGEMRRMVKEDIDQINERLERLETMMKIQHHRRQDRRKNVEDEYDVRRQKKRALTFVENILREFDCVIERFKEFVKKENKKRESEEEKEKENESEEEKKSEKESKKIESVDVIGSFGEKETQIEKKEREKRGRSEFFV